MHKPLCLLALSLAAHFAARAAEGTQPSPPPLENAHAHNDYEHARPLLDALDQGFCSVEADIYLVEGQLLVAHERARVKPERTLQALYLDPLRARAKQNNGRIYPGGPTLTLLVDIKSDAEPTYAVLREVLRQYADILTHFSADATEPKAVTVILSGNRPRETLARETSRYAALDGRLADLQGKDSRHFMPLISDNWTGVFKWRGLGPLPNEEKQKLRGLVEQTRSRGQRLRFWGTADRPEVWRELHAAGVDLINTDDLAGLRKFLSSQPRPPAQK